MPVTALTTTYRRDGSFFIASSDRTTDGVWVGSGSVERVDGPNAVAIGAALNRQLDRSVLDVPHPRQDQWPAQGRKSLDPIIALAKLRSWRSFIRDATVAAVERDGDTVRIIPQARDGRRADVFRTLTEHVLELLGPTDHELGAALLEAFDAQRPEGDRT